MDWEKFTPGYTLARRRPLIEDIPEVARVLREEAEPADGEDDSAGSAFRAELARLSAPEQHDRLLQLVRTEAAGVLTHQTTDEITAGRPFKDLGFDSLTAMERRPDCGCPPPSSSTTRPRSAPPPICTPSCSTPPRTMPCRSCGPPTTIRS
jgi:hypothetical protein